MKQQNAAAFVIGVTGNMDPLGYGDFEKQPEEESVAIQAIRRKIYAAFDWVRKSGWLDRQTGQFHPNTKIHASNDNGDACWNSLALGEEMPIIVLSSLAPGIDTIVAEAVFDYERQCEAKGEAVDISLRAPLPFPVDIYPEATTFRSDLEKQRFFGIVEKIEAKGEIQRDLFPVGLHPKQAGDPREDLTASSFEGKRRYLRYRAAGEYVAGYCDLLLALYDEEKDGLPGARSISLYDSGSAAIVEVKRHGMTHDLLPVQNTFGWADSGPVIHIPIDRWKKNAPEGKETNHSENTSGLGCDRSLTIYYPVDCQPENFDNERAEDHLEWHRIGDGILRSIAGRLTVLQRETRHFRKNAAEKAKEKKDEEEEFLKMLTGKPQWKETAEEAKSVLEKARGFFDFAELARIRRNVANFNYTFDGQVKKTMIWLFSLGAVGIIALQGFENLHFIDAHSIPKEMSWGLVVLFILTAICIVCGWQIHQHFGRKESENWQLDCRAIADGLRVQFYWAAAGTGESVASHYLQRQRGELSWIRSAISSVTFPHHRTVEWFRDLGKGDKLTVLRAIRNGWLGEQLGYFTKKSEEFKVQKHSIHQMGHALLAAGLLLLAALFFDETLHLSSFFARGGVGMILFGLVIFIGLIWRSVEEHRMVKTSGDYESPYCWRYLFPHTLCERCKGDPRWPVANQFIVGLAIAFVAWGSIYTWIPMVTGDAGIHTGSDHWLHIAKNCALAAGGLVLLWGNRKFLTQNVRRYSAMRALFKGACKSMDANLMKLEQSETKEEENRVVSGIQEQLVSIGCEALAENAEWLVMHRDSPVEMVMPGH
jgi:hypothetical protein